MSDAKRPPLRFWVGLHEDGSGRQVIVDFHGGPMEGVKQAWSQQNPGRLTTMETVIEPKFDLAGARFLELLKSLEGQLGDPRFPQLENLLRAVAMEAYEAGMQNAGLRPKRP